MTRPYKAPHVDTPSAGGEPEVSTPMLRERALQDAISAFLARDDASFDEAMARFDDAERTAA